MILAPTEEQPIVTEDVSEKLEMIYGHCHGKNDNGKTVDNGKAGKTQYIDAEKINAANVANHRAEAFYEEHGVKHAAAAFELTDGARPNAKIYGTPHANTPLMTCRYCLRYAMGFCVKRGGKQPTWKEPLVLESSDGRQVKLVFNCARCQMEVYSLE